MSTDRLRHVKVRAYFHIRAEGVHEAGSHDVTRRVAPFPMMLPGDVYAGLTATHRRSDDNYVRLDLPVEYASADAAGAAAAAMLKCIVNDPAVYHLNPQESP